MQTIIVMILLDAFDEVFMYQTLTDIQAGKTCTIPVYNYKTNSRYLNTKINKLLLYLTLIKCKNFTHYCIPTL